MYALAERHIDRLAGTRSADVICGLGGNDTLATRGNDATDIVDGGGGEDRIAASSGVGSILLVEAATT
jgi:Ca2+-binding RTX toxin-like protein